MTSINLPIHLAKKVLYIGQMITIVVIIDVLINAITICIAKMIRDMSFLWIYHHLWVRTAFALLFWCLLLFCPIAHIIDVIIGSATLSVNGRNICYTAKYMALQKCQGASSEDEMSLWRSRKVYF